MFSILARSKGSSLCRGLMEPQKPLSRNIAFLEKLMGIHPHPRLVDKAKHRVIYEFKYIAWEAAALKLKYSLPVLTGVFVPVAWVATGSAMAAVGVFSGIACQVAIIFGLSKVLRNTVGKIYVNRENDKEVVVSSIDSHGRRVDRIHDADAFTIPAQKNLFLGFIKVSAVELDYKVNIKNCLIHDMDALSQMFGTSRFFSVKAKR